MLLHLWSAQSPLGLHFLLLDEKCRSGDCHEKCNFLESAHFSWSRTNRFFLTSEGKKTRFSTRKTHFFHVLTKSEFSTFQEKYTFLKSSRIVKSDEIKDFSTFLMIRELLRKVHFSWKVENSLFTKTWKKCVFRVLNRVFLPPEVKKKRLVLDHEKWELSWNIRKLHFSWYTSFLWGFTFSLFFYDFVFFSIVFFCVPYSSCLFFFVPKKNERKDQFLAKNSFFCQETLKGRPEILQRSP